MSSTIPSLTDRIAGGRGAVLDRTAQGAYRAGRLAGRVEVALARVPGGSRVAVALLVCVNWLVMLEVAHIAVHRGWLYFDGGEGTRYYTAAWVLAHGHVPPNTVGYGYPLLLAPIAALAGPNLLAGLPYVVFANAILLSPLVLLAVYGLAKAIGGVRFALGAALLWVVLPLIAIRYFLPDYHARYVDVTLPPALGLTAVGEYPSMVCVAVAAFFAYRALAARGRVDAVLAGLATAVAIGVAPGNVLFALAAVAALAVARRPRQLALYAAGVAPALVAVALWRYRGGVALGHDVHVNWAIYKGNLDGLRKWGWSKRLLEWVAVAGLVGLARRTLPGAVLVGGWLAAYLVIEGGDPRFSISTGKFLIEMLPALPAFVVLALSLVYLPPIFGRRALRVEATRTWPQGPRATRTVVAVLALLALVPIVVVAALPPLSQPRAALVGSDDVYAVAASFPFPDAPLVTVAPPEALGSYGVDVPTGQFPLSERAVVGGVVLSWPSQPTHGTAASYIVFRSAGDALGCVDRAHAAASCSYGAVPIAVVPATTNSYLVDTGSGRWSYRVALAASPVGPATDAYPLLLSDPVVAARRG